MSNTQSFTLTCILQSHMQLYMYTITYMWTTYAYIYTHVHITICTPSHTQLHTVQNHICKHLYIITHTIMHIKLHNHTITFIYNYTHVYNLILLKYEFGFYYYHPHFSDEEVRYRELWNITQLASDACIWNISNLTQSPHY